MAQLKFYRGLKANYVAETTHKDGIYFATDTNEILMNGKAYTGALASGKVVTNVSLSADKSKLVVTYSDSTTTEIEVGSGKYTSAIEDKELATLEKLGGIAKGTKVSDLEGNTYDYLWDTLLFPTVKPSYTPPSASISFSGYSSPKEVGSVAPTEAQLKTGFNPGAINIGSTKQADRAGALVPEDSFIFVNGQETNMTLPTTVALGNTSYQYKAAYLQGPQPKDSKGNDFGTPLPAGSVKSSSISINGTYPWYASTAAATTENPVIKQSLISWNASPGAMVTPLFKVQPSGILPQVFKTPKEVTKIQKKDATGTMLQEALSAYTKTTEEISINGTPVTYYVYTYNGSARGESELIINF